MELPYDSTIPPLGIYPENTKALIQKDICTPTFTAALVTIAKAWKQRLSIHQQRTGYGRRGTYAQWGITWPIKMNKIMPFAAMWMNPETIMLSKVRRERQNHMTLTCRL